MTEEEVLTEEAAYLADLEEQLAQTLDELGRFRDDERYELVNPGGYQIDCEKEFSYKISSLEKEIERTKKEFNL